MTIHHYIPNSSPEIKKELLDGIGVRDSEKLLSMIPERIRFHGRLDLPGAASEFEVRRRIEALLSKSRTSNELLSFVGAGCWPQYVQAVCDEISSRSEFLTAYTSPEIVKKAPHNCAISRIDSSPSEDPNKWALTRRAYLKKQK
jgi:glycine dehydrogenase subunit 1